MATITVEVNKDKDLSAVKEFIARLGLKYHVKDSEGLLYTDEIKSMLDNRYNDYLQGKVDLIDGEESRERIQGLLADKSK